MKFLSFTIIAVVLLFGCVYTPNKNSELIDVGDVLLENVLNSKINLVKKNAVLNERYNLKDTVMEEEGVEWKAIALKSKSPIDSEFAALLETNWEDQSVISRISILGERIGIKGIHVGDAFEKIKYIIDSTNLNGSPDGELSLTYGKDNRIHFLLELAESSPLNEGVGSLDGIPGELQIKEIVLLNRK
ncbi:hypothetical protein CLV59_109235 [Chitinophaga dinghuensis]|uniref:Lipoprotein n=1 Tax=Chitinophaga dinghuensis TaxID=1539050 RepID=A0A327VWR3_9BACT|nr:hypothetical protein [Chitinophaga dinghuensis]RAJ75621.1 hypothetical protein CLV59_109235 [Chitinophaga dinghuensis]